jgi:hypothetical protein
MGKSFVVDSRAMLAQGGDGAFAINGVPEDDGSDNQVEPACAMTLVLEAPATQVALRPVAEILLNPKVWLNPGPAKSEARNTYLPVRASWYHHIVKLSSTSTLCLMCCSGTSWAGDCSGERRVL